MKQVCIEWQGQVCDVLVNECDQVCLDDGMVLKEGEFCWLLFVNGMLFVLGLNYVDYVSELEFKLLIEFLVFIKVLNIFIGYQQQLVCLDNVEYMYYEVELVVVIGKIVCCVSEVEVMDYVVGYIVCNDYVICDYLENYYCLNLWVKSCDILMLIGLWIVSKEVILDLYNLVLCIWVNGELCQQGIIVDLIFSILFFIVYLSEFMIL